MSDTRDKGFSHNEQVRRAQEALEEILCEHPEMYGKIELNFQAGRMVNSNVSHAGPRAEKGNK